MTWGHVGALTLLLAIAFGAAASAVLRADPPAVASATPAPAEAPALAVPEAVPAGIAPSAEPAPPETVWVKVSGDAEQVELVRGSRRVRLPARVAPGTWELEVRFPGAGASVERGSVDVRAGLNVRCEADFMRCEW